MNVLGIDWGEKRIGLAFADSLAIAVPIEPAIQKKLKERLAHLEKERKQSKGIKGRGKQSKRKQLLAK